MDAVILEVDLSYQVRTQVNVSVAKGLDFTTMYQQAKEQARVQIMQNNASYVLGSVEYLNCEFAGSTVKNASLPDDDTDQIARLYDGFDAEFYAEQANIQIAEDIGIAEWEAKIG